MKKIIVTGGLGFIGSNLIELLLSKNFYVINIDKVTYSSNFYNTKEFKKNKNYKFIKCDINNKKIFYSIRPSGTEPLLRVNLQYDKRSIKVNSIKNLKFKIIKTITNAC